MSTMLEITQQIGAGLRGETVVTHDLEEVRRRIKEELMTRLELGDMIATDHFRQWVQDESFEAVNAMFFDHADGRTRKEVIDDWRARWCEWLLDDQPWQQINSAYKLNVQGEF